MPDPIEAYLSVQLTDELAGLGISNANVVVLSAESEAWRYRVTVGGRVFEAGFNHREQLWCREVTSGSEKTLISNDAPRIGTGKAARQTAVFLIHRSLTDPAFPPRDPPVL